MKKLETRIPFYSIQNKFTWIWMVERWIILTHSIATGVYTRFATFEKWLNESAPATQFALNALEKHISCCSMARYYEYALFFLNTTIGMCSCVITQWVLYTNRPDSIALLYSFEWNCIASTHSYSHWNIYIYILSSEWMILESFGMLLFEIYKFS